MIIQCLRSGLPVAFLASGVAALSLSCPSRSAARTDPCTARQQAVELLRSRIKADQKAIKDLGIGITEPDLDDATNIAENGRKKAMLAAALSLLDGFLSAPEGALGTKSIDGMELRNGLGSIGTGQANALIAKIRAEGGKQALIPLLRRLSQMTGKTSQLEYLDALSKAASALKSVAELGAADNTLEEAEAFFALATAMVGPVALADSVVNAVLNSAMNEAEIFLLAKDVDQLTDTTEKQLKSLKVLSAKLEADVKTLQRMTGTDVCDSDISWQIALQNQRMEAAASGNIDFYNELLRLHAQIFKQLGLRACESGFYPGGCNKAPLTQEVAAQGSGSSCPPFSARNAQDALQVEHSSHKDVCWAYNGKTLIATSLKSPDKANKPFLSNSGPGGANRGAEISMPTVDNPTPSRSRRSETTTEGTADDAIITKTSHARWDTLHPLPVGRGQTSVHYYPELDGKSNIYVAHLVTKSQVRPGSKAELQWCSALLFNGVPFTYDTFAHNRNYASLGECTEISYAHIGVEGVESIAIDEKGRPVRAPSGERVYVAGDRIDLELNPGPFNPGAYTLLVCPPFLSFSGKPPDDVGDTPIYGLWPRANTFINPTELTCQSEDYGLHARGKEHWSGPLAPLGTFKVNLSPGISATVTVKSY